MKRVLAIIAALAMILNLAACETGGANGTETPSESTMTSSQTVAMGEGTLSLYFTISDSLNPYEAETAGNQNLTALLFDGLTGLDPDANVELKMAQSVETSGTRCVVTLKDVVFSDGSAVSASDVTYSLGLAKEAENGVYTQRLSNIRSWNASSSSQIELTLSHPDPNIAAVLSFPIIKEGSTGRENEDKKQQPPIGAGRYVYNDDSGAYSLTANTRYYGEVPQNTIQLVNAPDDESLEYYIKSGEVDIYYSGIELSNLPPMSGQIPKIKQTNFVFLNVNTARSAVNSSALRKAVAQMVDREEICRQAYYGYAEPATSPYLTGLDLTENYDNLLPQTTNVETGQEYLTVAGYAQQNDGSFEDENGNAPAFTLLYNSDNNFQTEAASLIADQLASGGIDITLQGEKSAVYRSYVANGAYDMYIGEIRLSDSFDLTALLSGNVTDIKTTTTTTATTTTTQSTTGADGQTQPSSSTTTPDKTETQVDISAIYGEYMNGERPIAEFLDAMMDFMPLVPLAYRLGVVSCNASVSPVAVSSLTDAYYNIQYLSSSN